MKMGRGLHNHCVPNDYLIPVPEKSLMVDGSAAVLAEGGICLQL